MAASALQALIRNGPEANVFYNNPSPGFRKLINHPVAVMMEARAPSLGITAQLKGGNERGVFDEILNQVRCGSPRSIVQLAEFSFGRCGELYSPAHASCGRRGEWPNSARTSSAEKVGSFARRRQTMMSASSSVMKSGSSRNARSAGVNWASIPRICRICRSWKAERLGLVFIAVTSENNMNQRQKHTSASSLPPQSTATTVS